MTDVKARRWARRLAKGPRGCGTVKIVVWLQTLRCPTVFSSNCLAVLLSGLLAVCALYRFAV